MTIADDSLKPLRVGDLFCGAGGFAEGFSQAGFEIAWGVDNWAPAVETFKRNHPDSAAITGDLRSLHIEELKPVDVTHRIAPMYPFLSCEQGRQWGSREGDGTGPAFHRDRT